MVITGLTRNQLTGNRPWVRIPPAPPYFGMWLSLVEHYVRDVGAAGSNPVIPTTFLPQLVFRGVAQLVARASGGRGAAGSSPVTPTKRISGRGKDTNKTADNRVRGV